MGYQTYFGGEFKCEPPLNKAQVAYLKAFNDTRRMKRDVSVFAANPDFLKDPLREAVKLPLGADGEFYVGSYDDGKFGQGPDASVVDHNSPPKTQPGLWCQWVPTDDGSAIVWDEGEKFYDYVEWIVYIVKNFLQPWEIGLQGSVSWDGEETGDMGTINVDGSIVSIQEAEITYRDPVVVYDGGCGCS